MAPSIRALLLALPAAYALNSTHNATDALKPSCAPGGNFDLSAWQLQLPTGSAGNVDTVSGSKLSGCAGFQDHDHFYTAADDGALVMVTPGSDGGCAKTSGSEHCRTEFRETGSWKPSAGTNRLAAELAGFNGSSVVIGQVFQADSGFSKPFAELYYSPGSGEVQLGVAKAQQGGGGQQKNKAGTAAKGTKFSYELRFEKNRLCVGFNGGDCKEVDTFFDTPGAYFKAGDYNQGDDDAMVKFYSLEVSH